MLFGPAHSRLQATGAAIVITTTCTGHGWRAQSKNRGPIPGPQDPGPWDEEARLAKSVDSDKKKDEIPPELVELSAQVDQLPRAAREKLGPLCDRVVYFVQLQARLIRIAQDAIDQLHLDNRYLLFDVEATRRDRDALRAELGNWADE